MDRSGQTLIGKYRVLGPIGQGGMGEVWHGQHLRTGRKVAIKTLDQRFLNNRNIVQRFGREARAASAIQHPGIVEVLDLDTTEDGAPFIVMEFLEGESLAKRIDTRGRMSEPQAVGVVRQLLEALDAAHAHGVIHRDLKPDNIFLVPAPNGQELVKILDFGISHKSDELRSRLTQTGAVLGTPHYMSPEQAMGDLDLDGRADLYAVGVVFYECVVGDLPYDAPNYNKLLHTILHVDPPPPTARGAQMRPAIEDVIVHALQKKREDRPATAGAMLRELDDAVKFGKRVALPSRAAAQVSSDPAFPSVPAQAAPLASPRLMPDPAPSAVPLTIGELDIPSTGESQSKPPDAIAAAVAKAASMPASIPPAGASPSGGSPAAPGAPPAPAASGPAPPLVLSPAPPAAPPSDPAKQKAAAQFDFGAAESGIDGGDAEGGLALELDESALAPRGPKRASPEPETGGSGPSGRFQAEASSTRLQRPDVSSAKLQRPDVSSTRLSRAAVQEAMEQAEADEASAPPPVPGIGERLVTWARGLPKAVWYGVAFLVAFTVFVVTVRSVVSRSTEGPAVALPTEPEEPSSTTPVPSNDTVTVELTGVPFGAQLLLDGLPGVTLPIRIARGGQHTLEIRAAGFETKRIDFIADSNKRIAANMVREGVIR